MLTGGDQGLSGGNKKKQHHKDGNCGSEEKRQNISNEHKFKRRGRKLTNNGG